MPDEFPGAASAAPTAPAAPRLTMNETIQDLTGIEYDNLVRLCKGADVTEYAKAHPVEFTYALITIIKLRTEPEVTLTGVKGKLKVGQLDDYFEPSPDEDDATQAGSDTGNV